MSDKKAWTLVGVTLVFSTTIVLALFIMSADFRRRQGSFLREFPPHVIIETDTLDLKYPSYYLAGSTDHTLYLGNYEKPLHLISVDLNSLDTTHVQLNVDGVMDRRFWSPRVKVDSPSFYFVDGAVPRIYRGEVSSWRARQYPYDSGFYFDDIVAIDQNRFILKTVSPITLENVIGLLQSKSPRYKANDSILEKQVDGRFCTDGMLHYNKSRQELLYLYRYRNEFMVMDTALRLKYRGHTIDTTSVAKLRTADIPSARQRVLSAPALSVNLSSSLAGNFLFVRSETLAKNQQKNAFDQATVIDVYQVDHGTYQFSFYVFHFQHKKSVEQFKVVGNRLVILYEGVISVYEMQERYFKEL